MNTVELLTLLNLLTIIPMTVGTGLLIFILRALHQIEHRLTHLEARRY